MSCIDFEHPVQLNWSKYCLIWRRLSTFVLILFLYVDNSSDYAFEKKLQTILHDRTRTHPFASVCWRPMKFTLLTVDFARSKGPAKQNTLIQTIYLLFQKRVDNVQQPFRVEN